MTPPLKTRGRRTLLMLALVCAAPVVASYVAYYWFRPPGQVNYGELVEARPVQEIVGTLPDGGKFRLSDYRGRWLLLAVDAGPCEDECQRKLYATRQARTIQGREQDRVVRMWLQATDAPALAPQFLAQHPGLIVARVDPAQWAALPGVTGPRNIYLIDPLGNIVLRYPADPDIKRMAKDLERLLRASRIG
ncbi:MAG TPA: cytochrome C oxidase subunit I [Casimicrobiaceae bacterium]|nr:cytochrome C oxidase subunit I [Casimicrobiaceae bacterium]